MLLPWGPPGVCALTGPDLFLSARKSAYECHWGVDADRSSWSHHIHMESDRDADYLINLPFPFPEGQRTGHPAASQSRESQTPHPPCFEAGRSPAPSKARRFVLRRLETGESSLVSLTHEVGLSSVLVNVVVGLDWSARVVAGGTGAWRQSLEVK